MSTTSTAILSGVAAGLISGGAAFYAARLQAEATVKAAVESAVRREVATQVTSDGGIWIIGSRKNEVVFCVLQKEEQQKPMRQRKVECTEGTFFYTY